MSQEFVVPWVINWLGTFLWAISGGLAAIRRKCDVMGVFVIALVSATGGGFIRDGMFLHRTPVVVSDPYYLLVVIFVTCGIAALGPLLVRIKLLTKFMGELILLIDSVGTPGFAIVGMQLALSAGISLPGVVLIGAVNGVGGGVLRDLLLSDVPSIIQPGQLYALVVIVCCVQFLFLTLSIKMDPNIAGWLSIATFFMIRVLVIHFDWRTSPVMK
jgi:uncharacterized membrane protein YeiH